DPSSQALDFTDCNLLSINRHADSKCNCRQYQDDRAHPDPKRPRQPDRAACVSGAFVVCGSHADKCTSPPSTVRLNAKYSATAAGRSGPPALIHPYHAKSEMSRQATVIAKTTGTTTLTSVLGRGTGPGSISHTDHPCQNSPQSLSAGRAASGPSRIHPLHRGR